jgi:hypothetical protein
MIFHNTLCSQHETTRQIMKLYDKVWLWKSWSAIKILVLAAIIDGFINVLVFHDFAMF